MKILGMRKSLFFALIFFVLPFGGMIVWYHLQPEPGYSLMVSMDKGKVVIDDCQESPQFEPYLKRLNKLNKPNNIICNFAGDVTTMSKSIQCEVVNGPVSANIYWAENKAECEKIKQTLRK